MPAPRRGARGGDLVLGALLAVVLVIACLAWEVTSGSANPAGHGAHHAAEDDALPSLLASH